jgi:lysophospholipase L1-like esterase
MRSSARRIAGPLLVVLLVAAPTPGFGQQADPDPARFKEAIDRFEHWDTQNAFPAQGVLFVGSSSIVRWPTADRFPELPVINRGFGGSHISDVNHYIEQTILKYSPDVIVFYAGNNDINAGKSPQQVFEDYQQFTDAVHARKSDTEIVYIAIHPSPRRHYADIAPAMLGSDGRPQPHLFVADGLHLSPAGYDAWTPIVAKAIEAVR